MAAMAHPVSICIVAYKSKGIDVQNSHNNQLTVFSEVELVAIIILRPEVVSPTLV